MEDSNRLGKLMSFVPVALIVGVMMIGSALLGLYFGVQKHPNEDPLVGKSNAESMLEFTRTLPDDLAIYNGSRLSESKSFSAYCDDTSRSLNVTSLPSSQYATAKEIVAAEMKSQGWEPFDIQKSGTMSVGGEEMYYVLKKDPARAPEESDESDSDVDKDKPADTPASTDGENAKTAPVSDKGANATVPVIYATKNIERGEIIAQEALEAKMTPADKAPEDAFDSVNAVVGQQATYPIAAGKIISMHSIGPIKMLHGERSDRLIGAVVTKTGKKYLLEGTTSAWEDYDTKGTFRLLSYIKRWR